MVKSSKNKKSKNSHIWNDNGIKVDHDLYDQIMPMAIGVAKFCKNHNLSYDALIREAAFQIFTIPGRKKTKLIKRATWRL